MVVLSLEKMCSSILNNWSMEVSRNAIVIKKLPKKSITAIINAKNKSNPSLPLSSNIMRNDFTKRTSDKTTPQI